MMYKGFYNKIAITILIIAMLLFNPRVVSANIMCNDGSRSPSCSDCHQGCCSHHGGCATDNSNYYNNEIEDSESESYSEVEENEDYNESEENEGYEDSKENEDYENSAEIVDYDESDDDNNSDSSGIILPLLIGGGIAGAVALGNKNKSKFIDKQ